MKRMQKKSIPVGTHKVKDAKTPMTYKDRNLMGMNPMKEQFEPTDAEPVRQHHRMAGV